MRGLWEKVRKKWHDFWKWDECETSKQHLSQAERYFLLYSNFLSCFCTAVFILIIFGVSDFLAKRQNDENMQEIVNMVQAYMASATEDEYDKITQTIRHDLVFSKFCEDIKNCIQYIPNTTEECCTCREEYPARVMLVSLNTGQGYSLDLFEKGRDKNVNQGGKLMTFGYDEISQLSISISKDMKDREGSAKLNRGNRIISVHRMKNLFCDDCIEQILNTVEGHLVEEVIIFDSEEKKFYPIEDDMIIRIGEYSLETEYKESNYKIMIKYIDMVE